MSDDLNVVSVEDAQGRILSGVGADADQLAETMERHAPDEPVASPSVPLESPTPAESKPPETRGRKRFAQLSSERDKALNEAAAIAKERDELRQKLEAASRQPEPPKAPEAPKETPLPATRELLTKMPAALKTFDAYVAVVPDADYEEWRDARNVWLYQQQTPDIDAVVRHRIEADTASRTQAQRIEQEVARGRQAYADFDAVIQNAPHMQANDWPLTLVQAIQNLEEPEHIRYQLAKDPVLSQRLKTLDPVSAGIELAKLITPKAAVAMQASTAPTGTVSPPAPYQPVGAGSKTTAPPLGDLPKKAGFDFDKSGWRERRAAERGVTRRR